MGKVTEGVTVRSRLRFEDFKPLSSKSLRLLLAPLYAWFSPRLKGIENFNPQRPTLFVGNHALYGVIDSPLFVSEVYRKSGVYLRPLGDHFHFRTDGWGDALIRMGAVPGTPENCARLMQLQQHILVFPGGAREVAKRRSEINRIEWKKRTGFARMAIQHGYDIIPFASVGCDESMDILIDADDVQSTRLGRWLLKRPAINRFLRNGDLIMPLARGVGPTLIPRPEPFWFQLGTPIETRSLEGRTDDETLWALREQVAGQITGMIDELVEQRRQAPLSGWRKRLLKRP